MKEKGTYHTESEDLNLPETLRKTPFTVPENYFVESAHTIRNLIAIEKLNNKSEPKVNLPINYFEDLKQRILEQTKLEGYQEKPENTWAVPEHYFTNLTEQLKASSRIDTITKDGQGFTVPKDYFNELSSTIACTLAEQRLKKQVSATSGFEVPEQYFSRTSERIKAKVFQSANANEVERPIKRLPVHKWFGYAAAACISFILAFGTYYALKQENVNYIEEPALSTISDDEIINYLASSTCSEDVYYIMEYMYHPGDSDGICKHVEEDDIKDYLNYML